ncbi:unnamed protein product [Pieris macdunnoughi]|uniref:Uncharacterized protein n=1 Tax=Pieris macdunnoughi TaxID=345717 RepID=A0A821KWA8_9NEOP|nr:unnamed protein product [Pieris macdunnoughi]
MELHIKGFHDNDEQMRVRSNSLGIVLLAVDLTVAQEARRVAVELQGADAAAQAGRVPCASAHLQQEPVRDRLSARAARAVLRLYTDTLEQGSFRFSLSYTRSRCDTNSNARATPRVTNILLLPTIKTFQTQLHCKSRITRDISETILRHMSPVGQRGARNLIEPLHK